MIRIEDALRAEEILWESHARGRPPLSDGSLVVLATLPVNNAKVFGQPVFAGTGLYVATESSGLYAFGG